MAKFILNLKELYGIATFTQEISISLLFSKMSLITMLQKQSLEKFKQGVSHGTQIRNLQSCQLQGIFH